MRIEVRFFASLAERAGRRTDTIEVDAGASVAELWRLLLARYPGLADTGVRPLVACDMVYAEWETTLDGVGEVAFLPPVSGG